MYVRWWAQRCRIYCLLHCVLIFPGLYLYNLLPSPLWNGTINSGWFIVEVYYSFLILQGLMGERLACISWDFWAVLRLLNTTGISESGIDVFTPWNCYEPMGPAIVQMETVSCNTIHLNTWTPRWWCNFVGCRTFIRQRLIQRNKSLKTGLEFW